MSYFFVLTVKMAAAGWIAFCVFLCESFAVLILWFDAWSRATPIEQVELAAEVKRLLADAEVLNSPSTFVEHSRATRSILVKEKALAKMEKCHPSTCDFTLPVWVAYIIPPALRYVAPALLLLVCSAMLDPGVLVNLGPVQDAIGSTAAWMILNPVVDTMNPISGGPPAAVEASAAGRGAMSVALWVALCKVAARRVVGMNAYVSVQR